MPYTICLSDEKYTKLQINWFSQNIKPEFDQEPMHNYLCMENFLKSWMNLWQFNHQNTDYEKLCKANVPISLINK